MSEDLSEDESKKITATSSIASLVSTHMSDFYGCNTDSDMDQDDYLVVESNLKSEANRRAQRAGASHVFDKVTIPRHIQEIMCLYGLVNLQDISLLDEKDFEAMEEGMRNGSLFQVTSRPEATKYLNSANTDQTLFSFKPFEKKKMSMMITEAKAVIASLADKYFEDLKAVEVCKKM
jgi:hypothetical protein